MSVQRPQPCKPWPVPASNQPWKSPLVCRSCCAQDRPRCLSTFIDFPSTLVDFPSALIDFPSTLMISLASRLSELPPMSLKPAGLGPIQGPWQISQIPTLRLIFTPDDLRGLISAHQSHCTGQWIKQSATRQPAIPVAWLGHATARQ